MFGIGSTELLIIIVVALLVLGPQKLPQVLRTVGKGMAELKRMSSDVKHTLDLEMERADLEERKKKEKKRLFEDKKGEKGEAPDDGKAAEKEAEKPGPEEPAKDAAEVEVVDVTPVEGVKQADYEPVEELLDDDEPKTAATDQDGDRKKS